MSADPGRSTVTAVGGPTALLALAGLRLITDPTFDPPGDYEPRPGVTLTKSCGPALSPKEIGSVDAVLLSHDQHLDNLDRAGRDFLVGAPLILTTISGAERLGGVARPLANWSSVDLERPDGGVLRVLGVPARHGPDGTERMTGEVTGFVLTGEGLPTIYVSGDNASLHVVRGIVERLGSPDVAVLFAGGAQVADLGDAYLTLPDVDAAEAARILGARTVVPVHIDGGTHLSHTPDALRRAFMDAGLGDRLAMVEPGATVTV
jgi:L-ascorbate metabolism protein UlaG (beta-lactamase superfamily)